MLAHIARFALLSSLSDPPQITYRHEALEDFVAHPELARQIYAVALAMGSSSPLVGNTAEADDKALVVTSGANSTLLRSIGLAQLMMECGMFVGADSYRANVARGVFTYFVRQEDATADRLEPGALVLFNESFAAANERETSEIARQIVQGLVDAGAKVVLVTHQYTLESSALFLRAQRDAYVRDCRRRHDADKLRRRPLPSPRWMGR